jgi:hypothetical protein
VAIVLAYPSPSKFHDDVNPNSKSMRVDYSGIEKRELAREFSQLSCPNENKSCMGVDEG